MERRLRELEDRFAELQGDLKTLRALVEHDRSSALNKIRYVTEKVLHRLCRKNDVSWGSAEPTLERMIGPLLAKGVIPKNVGIHVRTIQANASPGSHYQEHSLGDAHLQVAQLALVELLEWYYRATEPERSEPASLEPVSEPPREQTQVKPSAPTARRSVARYAAVGIAAAVVLGGGIAAVLLIGDTDGVAPAPPPVPRALVPAPPEDPVPTVAAAPSRPPAINPFAEPLPAELETIAHKVNTGRSIFQSDYRVLSEYSRANPTDVRGPLLIAHGHMNDRYLSGALPIYRDVLPNRPEVRGDPLILANLLELVCTTLDSFHIPAAILVVDVYGLEAIPAIEARLQDPLRDHERAHLIALQEQIESLE